MIPIPTHLHHHPIPRLRHHLLQIHHRHLPQIHLKVPVLHPLRAVAAVHHHHHQNLRPKLTKLPPMRLQSQLQTRMPVASNRYLARRGSTTTMTPRRLPSQMPVVKLLRQKSLRPHHPTTRNLRIQRHLPKIPRIPRLALHGSDKSEKRIWRNETCQVFTMMTTAAMTIVE